MKRTENIVFSLYILLEAKKSRIQQRDAAFRAGLKDSLLEQLR
tara:strand:- start:266 stop:394 length:129 start_codon:yes stop_codon:yes gene_type:complete